MTNLRVVGIDPTKTKWEDQREVDLRDCSIVVGALLSRESTRVERALIKSYLGHDSVEEVSMTPIVLTYRTTIASFIRDAAAVRRAVSSASRDAPEVGASNERLRAQLVEEIARVNKEMRDA